MNLATLASYSLLGVDVWKCSVIRPGGVVEILLVQESQLCSCCSPQMILRFLLCTMCCMCPLSVCALVVCSSVYTAWQF